MWIVLSASAALKTTLVGIRGSCSLSYRRTRVSGSILNIKSSWVWWVSLTEIILSWSLINILIYTLKYHVVQRSCATPHFFIFFDSIFDTRSQLTVIFLSGDKNMCPGFLKTPWKLCSAPWLIFFTYVQSSPCTWPFSMECFIFWLILTYTFNSS